MIIKNILKKNSSIEIELITCKSKKGEYIKIEEDKEQYYHIYFNKSKKEIKRKYLKKKKK